MRPSTDFPIVIYRDDVEQEKVAEGEQLLVEFFRGNLIAGCVEALFAPDLPSSLPFFFFFECCCWFVYNTAVISSHADNLCWRSFG